MARRARCGGVRAGESCWAMGSGVSCKRTTGIRETVSQTPLQVREAPSGTSSILRGAVSSHLELKYDLSSLHGEPHRRALFVTSP